LRTPLAIAEASVPEIVKALFESSSWAGQGDTYFWYMTSFVKIYTYN
jgi:hypothetical protein